MDTSRQSPEAEGMRGHARYRGLIAFSYACIGLIVAASMAWEYSRIEANFESVAHETGVVLFRQTLHALEGRVCEGDAHVHDAAPSTETAPATNEVKIRLIDLHPIRPSGQPDAWESETLERFRQGALTERLMLAREDGTSVHRYMAPLPDRPGCIRCHARNDNTTAMRGAVSIALPAGKLVDIRHEQIVRMLVIHLVGFLMIAGLAHLAARRTYRHIRWLAQTSAGQQRLIDERTADLSTANAHLAREVEEHKRNQAQLEQSERLCCSVIESTHDGIAVVEGDRFIFVNARLADMLGFSVDAITGAAWIDFVLAADQTMVMKIQQQKSGGEIVPDRLRVRMRHGDPSIGHITVDLQIVPMKANDGHDADIAAAQWVISAKDISDRLRAERDQRFAAAVFENTDEAIMVTDQEGHIVTVNPAFTRITGYSREEAVGQTPHLLNSGRHDKEFFADMWRTIGSSGRWSGEIWNRRKDGSLYVEWLSVAAVRDIGEGFPWQRDEACYVATFSDITKRKEAEDILRHRASHDILTNLPNRGLFDDRLQLAVSQAKRYQRSFALLYIDLDHFKEVNDTLGHAAGDELLTMTAQRMADCIRESDTLSRFGGDEFAVILSDVASLDEVRDVAGRIVATLADPFRLSDGTVEISGSVGIAIYPQHGNNPEQLKFNADSALYKVKREQRNAYHIYSAELNGAS